MYNILIFIAKNYASLIFVVALTCGLVTWLNVPFYPAVNVIGFILVVFVAIVAVVARVMSVQ